MLGQAGKAYMMNPPQRELGVLLLNGCRVTHGDGASVKSPFETIPVVMHELYPGQVHGEETPFRGQFGFIPFEEGHRLPRHVHMSGREGAEQHLIAERILVVGGVALAELNGEVLLAAPGTLVHIHPGVPHTWTACPPGVVLPDGTASDGRFLMIYEYSDPTGFFPIGNTTPLSNAADYQPYSGDLEAIRFPRLSAQEVVERASFVWGKEIRSDLQASS